MRGFGGNGLQAGTTTGFRATEVRSVANADGFTLSDGARLEHCEAEGNTAHGFDVGNGLAAIVDSQASNNGGAGLSLYLAQAVIRGDVFRDNAAGSISPAAFAIQLGPNLCPPCP